MPCGRIKNDIRGQKKYYFINGNGTMQGNLIVLYVLLSATVTLCRERENVNEILNLQGPYGLEDITPDAMKKVLVGLALFQKRKFCHFATKECDPVPTALILPILTNKNRKTLKSDVLVFGRIKASHTNEGGTKLRHEQNKKLSHRNGKVYISNWEPYGLKLQGVERDALKEILEGIAVFKRGGCPFSEDKCAGASAADVLTQLIADIIHNKEEERTEDY